MPLDPRKASRFNNRERDAVFQFSHIYPEWPQGSGKHGPLPVQRDILNAIRSGRYDDGYIVLQGGKGSAKTSTGFTTDFWVHHRSEYRGVDSIVARETYPSLITSTARAYWKELEARVPSRLIDGYKKPDTSSMGWINWKAGGTTFFVSTSNPDPWESAELGFIWVDEAHRHNKRNVRELMTRCRQNTGPRVRLITSNPMGRKVWFYELAHPKSKKRSQRSLWIEMSSKDNPTLSQGYIESLGEMYGVGTVAYQRWVEGKSTALEGAVLTQFDDNPASMIHVVPPIQLPLDAPRGRGLDWGVENPCAVVWAAFHDEAWWVYHTHRANNMSPEQHAEFIREGDQMQWGDEDPRPLDWTPADPEIFRKNRTDRESGSRFSVADEFYEAGIDLTPANNDRRIGLATVVKMVRVRQNKLHPVTLRPGAPRLFILDTAANEALTECLANLEWPDEDRFNTRNTPDDIRKKDDHEYDALRYLMMENPVDMGDLKPVRRHYSDDGFNQLRGRRPFKGSYRGYHRLPRRGLRLA